MSSFAYASALVLAILAFEMLYFPAPRPNPLARRQARFKGQRTSRKEGLCALLFTACEYC